MFGCASKAIVLGTLLAPLIFSYEWNLPKGFPMPRVPADNPMSAEKVELGRYLFYDPRLSTNGKYSCGSCHRQDLAFTDGRGRAIGPTGEVHPRGSMSLVNVAYSAVLTWGNADMRELERQALVPMYGTHPVELGLRESGEWLNPVAADERYRQMFARAYPGEAKPVTAANVVKAIASFERTIISGGSPWDRYHFGGDDHAVSPAVRRGEVLFFSAPLSCFRCHGGFNFSGQIVFEGKERADIELKNNGLRHLPSEPPDVRSFQAPTLRNIALTAPYMHDGRLATLGDVLDHYARGGDDLPEKDHLIRGFTLTEQNRADLIEFLKSLTDESLLRDPRFRNPW